MNDTTEIADHADHERHEAELTRRLQDIASTTVFDADAWDEIQVRIAARRWRWRPRWGLGSVFGLGAGSGPGAGARSPRNRWPVVAAVAAVVLFGLIVAFRRDEGLFVNTTNDKSSRGGHDAASTTLDDTTTSSSLLGGELPPTGGDGTGTGVGDGTGTGSGSGGAGSGSPGTGARDPGSGTGPGTGGSDSSTSPTTPATTVPPVTTLPDGRPPAVSIGQPGYTIEITAYQSGNVYYMNLWRDGSYYLEMWNWTVTPGSNCLAAGRAGTGDLANLRWGFVRSDAARVKLTTTSGNTSFAILGTEAAPGVRVWLAQRPFGQLDYVEALDAGGNVLNIANAPDFDPVDDTC